MSNSPTAEILGVHRIPITQELVEGALSLQFGASKGSSADEVRQVIDELSSIVLIEALISFPDERWDGAWFSQTTELHGRPNEQVQWNECYLSADGGQLLDSISGLPSFRIAFYLHVFDPEKPIDHPYGSAIALPFTAIPDRLARLTSYVPVD